MPLIGSAGFVHLMQRSPQYRIFQHCSCNCCVSSHTAGTCSAVHTSFELGIRLISMEVLLQAGRDLCSRRCCIPGFCLALVRSSFAASWPRLPLYEYPSRLTKLCVSFQLTWSTFACCMNDETRVSTLTSKMTGRWRRCCALHMLACCACNCSPFGNLRWHLCT